MNVVDANAVVLDDDKLTPYQMIEKVGRTCYKSEDLITDDSAEKFVKALQERRHYAMLEHYHLIFRINNAADAFTLSLFRQIFNLPYLLKYINFTDMQDELVISGSFRAFLEFFDYLKNSDDINISNTTRNTWLILEYKCHELYPLIFDDTYFSDYTVPQWLDYFTRSEFITFLSALSENWQRVLASRHLTHTVKFTCDRGVSHEFVRHRPASFAQESTRYCNYGKGKFGEEITVIKPLFFKDDLEEYKVWLEACESAEKAYFRLLNDLGKQPQEARSVLPNSLKTDLIITATEEEWQHIIELRYEGTTGKPHPQMVEVMTIAYEQLVKESNGRLKVEV